MSGKARYAHWKEGGRRTTAEKRLLIKGNAWRSPFREHGEEGKRGAVPKGQGKIMGKEGEERRNLLRAL